MNIITIMSDEHSYQVMGNAGDVRVQTPNLDRLAGEAISFTNAYTSCPVCAPARASWFTGQFVNRLGTWDNSTPYDGRIVDIANWLKRFQIPVYHFGKTHFHCDGQYAFTEGDFLGFLSSPDLGCYYREDKVERIGAGQRFHKIGLKTEKSFDDKVTERVLDWLEENQERQDDWVLNIGYLDPHFPFYVGSDKWNYYEKLIDQLPAGVKPPYTSLNEPLLALRKYFNGDVANEEIIRRVFIGYYAAVAQLDENIGRILDKLESCGLREKTVVIYTSDHGEQLGYHGLWWKCCMFEQSARIPLIIACPDRQAKKIEQPVSLVDLFPTICDLLKIPQPENISGQSLQTLMQRGRDPQRRDFAFSEYHAHGMPEGMFMIRWQQYKYVHFTNYPPQLFDLQADPAEDHDLVAEKANDPEIQALLQAGAERLRQVCEPEEVTWRAKEFQSRMKRELGLSDSYQLERGPKGVVPHPEYHL